MSDRPLDLDRLRKLTHAATPAPWVVEHRAVHATDESDELSGLGWEFAEGMGPEEPQLRGLFAKAADAHLIAECRTAIPVLLDEIERLETELATCHSEWRELRDRMEHDE